MIEGNGDIARVLGCVDRNDRVYFARGVSNSQEARESEYDRERAILLEQPRDKQLVYFGSLAVFYGQTRYTRHKLEMEGLIKEEFPRYAIVRLGNITWGDNPNTIVNFFRNKIDHHEAVDIRDEYRYMVDQGEFLHWMGMVPDWNVEMNITGRRMKVSEIVERYAYLREAIRR